MANATSPRRYKRKIGTFVTQFSYLQFKQQRNKPKEPPKLPERAPFFLPSLPGETLRFDVESKETEEEKETKTRRLEKNRAMEAESEFQRLLRGEDTSGDCK